MVATGEAEDDKDTEVSGSNDAAGVVDKETELERDVTV